MDRTRDRGLSVLSRKPANLSISRYEFAEQCLTDIACTRPLGEVIDIGAGDARMKPVAERLGLRWRGLDLEPRSAHVERWDLNEPRALPGPKAAAVFMLDVLEHLANPALALSSVAKILEADGNLLLTMPNPRWSRSRIYALTSGFPACFTQADLDGNGHIFVTWPHIVEKLLQNAGFEVLQYLTLDGTTSWPGILASIRRPQGLIHAAACKAIERYDTTACGMSYGILARLAKSRQSAC